jgi:HEPN domain-containing protein
MAMSPQDKFNYWLEVAQYDLQTAEAMLTTGRWLYVAFMCQQSVEKLVKGLYILYLDDNVPRTHSIETIAERFRDKLPSEIPQNYLDLFVTLSSCYFNNRYPEYKDKWSSQIKEPEAKALFSQTQEVFAWLLTLKP